MEFFFKRKLFNSGNSKAVLLPRDLYNMFVVGYESNEVSITFENGKIVISKIQGNYFLFKRKLFNSGNSKAILLPRDLYNIFVAGYESNEVKVSLEDGNIIISRVESFNIGGKNG